MHWEEMIPFSIKLQHDQQDFSISCSASCLSDGPFRGIGLPILAIISLFYTYISAHEEYTAALLYRKIASTKSDALPAVLKEAKAVFIHQTNIARLLASPTHFADMFQPLVYKAWTSSGAVSPGRFANPLSPVTSD